MHEPIDTIKDMQDTIKQYQQDKKELLKWLEIQAHKASMYVERCTYNVVITKLNNKDK